MARDLDPDQNDPEHWTQAVKSCIQLFTNQDFIISKVLSLNEADLILDEVDLTPMHRSMDLVQAVVVGTSSSPASSFIPSVGAVVALNGYPDTDTYTLAIHVKDRIVGGSIKWNIQEDIKNFTTMGQVLWNCWNGSVGPY